MELKHSQQGNTYTVAIIGDFTYQAHPEFKSLIEAIKANPTQHFVLDLTQVLHMDSAALGMLQIAHESAKNVHASICITGASGTIEKLLKLSGFDAMFDVK